MKSDDIRVGTYYAKETTAEKLRGTEYNAIICVNEGDLSTWHVVLFRHQT